MSTSLPKKSSVVGRLRMVALGVGAATLLHRSRKVDVWDALAKARKIVAPGGVELVQRTISGSPVGPMIAAALRWMANVVDSSGAEANEPRLTELLVKAGVKSDKLPEALDAIFHFTKFDSIGAAKTALSQETRPHSIEGTPDGGFVYKVGSFQNQPFKQMGYGWTAEFVEPDNLQHSLDRVVRLLEDGTYLPDGTQFGAVSVHYIDEQKDKIRIGIYSSNRDYAPHPFKDPSVIVSAWVRGDDSVETVKKEVNGKERNVLQWKIPNCDTPAVQAIVNSLAKEAMIEAGHPLTLAELTKRATPFRLLPPTVGSTS